MKEWTVDNTRLVQLLSRSMYSDIGLAGIRELISNSIDAKKEGKTVNIGIRVTKDSIFYFDDGKGMSTEEFTNQYGVVGSGHDRNDGSIGMFGIGRLALISCLPKRGGFLCTKDKLGLSSWVIYPNGYESLQRVPTTVQSAINTNNHTSFLIDFNQLDLDIDVDEVERNITATFGMPIAQNICAITFNDKLLKSPIGTYNSFEVKTTNGAIDVWHSVKDDGKIHYCHNGIEVRTESYSGIEAWVNQSFLDIKTDREGFINNKKYQGFIATVKSRLSLLRSPTSIQRMEVEFVNGIMKRFKKFAEGKIYNKINIPDRAAIVSNSDVIDDDILKVSAEEIVYQETDNPDNNSLVFTPDDNGTNKEPILYEQECDDGESAERNDVVVEHSEVQQEGDSISVPDDVDTTISTISDDTPVTDEKSETPISDIWDGNNDEEESNNGEESEISPLSEVDEDTHADEPEDIYHEEESNREITVDVRIADMGESYPMIFFEIDPFTVIYNNSHPALVKMLHESKSTRKARDSIIFLRMIECLHINNNLIDSSDIDTIVTNTKERWIKTDKDIVQLF